MVLRLHETDEARTDEKPIVETEEGGDTNPLSLLIFSSFDLLQNKRVSRLTVQFISCLNQWLQAIRFNPGNPNHHARRYQQAAIFSFVIPPHLPFVLPVCL